MRGSALAGSRHLSFHFCLLFHESLRTCDFEFFFFRFGVCVCLCLKRTINHLHGALLYEELLESSLLRRIGKIDFFLQCVHDYDLGITVKSG